MERNLFRDRHPLLYAFFHHSSTAAGLAFILVVLLEISTFVQLIRLKLCSFGNPSCSIGRRR